MIKKTYLFFSVLLISVVFSISCVTTGYNSFYPPENWPSRESVESEYINYYDTSSDLDPIEGIWTMYEKGIWRNIVDGTNGKIPEGNTYRLAITKDTTKTGYTYSAVVLEADSNAWTPGRVKAYFRNTAYEMIYDGLWFLGNYTEERSTYQINEKGVILKNFVTYDKNNSNIELTFEEIFIRSYPQFKKDNSSNPDNNEVASGSGFFISKEGIIVTNNHVIQGSSRIEVVIGNKRDIYNAKVTLKDTINDIAILNLIDFDYSKYFSKDIPYSIKQEGQSQVGEVVFTLGYPLGNIMGNTARMSTGNISSQYGINDDPRIYQISNPIQPGNSGGPLINKNGQVVGIVVATLNAKSFLENTGIIPQNVNFAIKSNILINLVSLLPNSEIILENKSLIDNLNFEQQVEAIAPFIVKINTY